ncbi:MAG: DEAD/DEAH box helicase [Alphaproteobacteria bacterium]
MTVFHRHDVKAAFPPAVFEQGRTLAADGRVLGVALSAQGKLLTGHVRDGTGRPYAITIHLEPSASRVRFIARCTCRSGRDCGHAVAVLLAFLTRKAASPRQAPTQSSAPAGDPLIAEWMGRLVGAARPGRRAAVEASHLLYVLTLRTLDGPGGSARLVVRPIIVRRHRDGRVAGYTDYDPTGGTKVSSEIDPEDLHLLRQLRATEGAETNVGLLALPSAGGSLLGALVATGRCVFETVEGPRLRPGGERPGRLEWTLAADATQRPRLVGVDDAMVLPLEPPWYLDRATGETGPLVTGLSDAMVVSLLRAPPLTPTAARDLRRRLIAERPELAAIAPLDVAVASSVRVAPTPCLRLLLQAVRPTRARKGGAVAQPAARLSFRYGDRITVSANDPTDEVSAVMAGEVRSYLRDRAAEEAAQALLAAAGLRRVRTDDPAAGDDWAAEPDGLTPLDAMVPFVVGEVPKLRRAGWRVDIDQTFPLRVVEDVGEWYGDLAEGSGVDWFGLELGVVIEGRKVNILPVLLSLIERYPEMLSQRALADLRDDRPLVLPLPDDRLLPVPAARLRAILATLVDLYDSPGLGDDGRLRLSGLRAAEILDLDAAVGGAVRWSGGGSHLDLGRRLRDFAGIAEMPPPAGLTTPLRPYQSRGVDWLQFLRAHGLGGILADDMGLGKTVQALTHILIEKESGRQTTPSLVVCPTSLVTTWRREAARFAPSLSVLTLHGPKRQASFRAIDRADVVITTYPLLPRDRDVLLGRRFHCAILDEAQVVKNPAAQAGQVARRLDAAHRLCLTGTPMENHLGELWSLFDFALPGLLGDEVTFRRRFRLPIEKRNDDSRRAALARRVRPFLLRRTKEDVAAELPPKTEIIRSIELEGSQRDLYETIRLAMHSRIREAIADRGLSRSRITILDALLKLRQVCCDPRLIKGASGGAAARRTVPSAKLGSLMEMLTELVDEGRRVLLFSQFTGMLDLIEAELTRIGLDYVILTGKTRDRATPVDRFQAGEVPLFLISLKAGGTGLTLTAADTVIHYDPWWNPAVEAQATDRAHRIGQDKAVFVYKLVAAGTVEEKMLELQDRKRALAAAVYDEAAAGDADWTTEELESLFAPLADESEP